MKHFHVIAAVMLCAAVLPVQAIEVYKSELENANQEIQFNSYTGPVTVFNTMAQIRGIGTELGEQIAAGSSEAGNAARYQVLHFSSDDPQKLDADVFVIGPRAGVDHIRNLRAIVSAYLVAAYGYSVGDADTLATFITIYNAVYRGDMQNIRDKYTEDVQNAVSPSILGLSQNYTDWPGKTQIIIPLTGRPAGTLSAVDTTVITDDEVVTNLKQESDKGVALRNEMTDLKNREAEEASQNAQEAARAAAEAATEVNKAKAEAATAQAAAAAAAKEAESANAIAEKRPEDQALQDQARAAEENAAAAAAAAQQAQVALAQAKDEAKAQEDIAAQEQAFADRKLKEAQDDTKAIQKDAATLPKTDELVDAYYGLALADKNTMLSEIVMFDSNTGKEVKTSPLNVIRGRTMFVSGDQFVAIAGQTGGNAAIRIVLIDGRTLEMTKQGEEPVSKDAVLIEHEGFFYTIVQLNGKWHVGKYDDTLALVAHSEIPVTETTPLFAHGKAVSVVDESGKVQLLNVSDLALMN